MLNFENLNYEEKSYKMLLIKAKIDIIYNLIKLIS